MVYAGIALYYAPAHHVIGRKRQLGAEALGGGPAHAHEGGPVRQKRAHLLARQLGGGPRVCAHVQLGPPPLAGDGAARARARGALWGRGPAATEAYT